MKYLEFLEKRSQYNNDSGFKPTFFPDKAFDFQKHLIDWTVRKGRSAEFADCGLGKSLMELAYAQNVVEHTNKNVLLTTPIAVGTQMLKEAEKFGIEANRSRDGKTKGKITITNYEQLHKFDPSDFEGIVCDESSILKNFKGKYKEVITIFSRKMKYRLLATATAAPNDFIELGTSSEALGYLGYMDMLSKFFINDMNNCSTNRRGRFTEATQWRLKNHAHNAFWRWVTSWARAIRFPSDLGFSNEGYILPPLIENDICISDFDRSSQGLLFALPAKGESERRTEQRHTIGIRCEKAAERAIDNDDYSVLWCNLNPEGDLLERLIPDSVQVSGKDSDDAKEEKLTAFTEGKVKKLITKPKIGAWGLNWQHCNHTIFFPTHSYEQKYQAIRRFLRFGQERSITIDNIFTDGDLNVIDNVKRKERQAEKMFKRMVEEMNNSMSIRNTTNFDKKQELPEWL